MAYIAHFYEVFGLKQPNGSKKQRYIPLYNEKWSQIVKLLTAVFAQVRLQKQLWEMILHFVSVLTAVYAHVCYVYQEPMGRGHGRLPRWWVSETNPCECTEMRLGGRNMVSYNRPYDQVTFLINGVLISTDPKEIQDFWGCEQISEHLFQSYSGEKKGGWCQRMDCFLFWSFKFRKNRTLEF